MKERRLVRLSVVGLCGALVACVCAGAFAWAPPPAVAAVGGSDPPLFTNSLLTIDAAGSFIQGRPFEMFATGSNAEPGGDQSDLVPYYLDLYTLSPKLASCPRTNAGMVLLVKQHPKDASIIIQPIPEASSGGPGLDGPFTTPVFQALTPSYGSMEICAYSTYAGEDAAWFEFGPVPVTRALPAKSFPSRSVRIGATGGCWPLAQTAKQQAQGLTSVRRPARPMLFTFKRAGSHAFSLLGVLTAMTGVWIGPGNKVIGRWHDTADSDTAHKPPKPVTAVALYPAGQRLPAVGARLRVGASCRSSAAL